jgi:diguanylate cyclase (GGDEF)-like protein
MGQQEVEMSKRRLGVIAAFGAVPMLVFAAWLLELWGGRLATRTVDDLGLLVFGVFATACCLFAARSSRGRRRATWLALGAGLAAWSVGEGIWCFYELWRHLPQAPFPSPADAGFLVFPVGAALALLLFPGGRLGQSHIRLVLDGVIVAGSLFVVSWVGVLASVYKAGGTSIFALVVSLAYPAADLVLVTMTVLVLVRARTAQRLTLGLLAAGVGLMAVSDSGFAYLTATNAYHAGNLIDVGWLAAFLVLGLAALSSTEEPAVDALAAPTPTRTRLWLPYVPLLVAGAVGLPRFLPGFDSGPVPGVALVLVLVVLVRQFITMAENRRLLVTVAHQALHDPLTGLANRALFTDRLDHAVQRHRRDLRPLALLFLDLDDFKLVNDSLGHPAGDDLLVRVAERLIGCLRTSDTVARLGGDEFAVLIEEGADHPLLVADRVVEAFERPFTIDGHSLAVRPSIGLVSSPGAVADISAESLLKQADVAMYAAKRGRAGGVHVFAPNMRLPHPDELGPRQHLATAVGG